MQPPYAVARLRRADGPVSDRTPPASKAQVLGWRRQALKALMAQLSRSGKIAVSPLHRVVSVARALKAAVVAAVAVAVHGE